MNNSATRAAYRFWVENNINSLPIDYESMLFLLRSNNIIIKTYGQARVEKNFTHLEQYAKEAKGFTYIREKGIIIYIQDELSLPEKVKVLAHELGHVELKHSFYGILELANERDENSPQEQEADEFAIVLLAPPCLLKHLGIHLKTDIKALTLLDEKDATHVMHRMQVYTSMFTEYEKRIISLYEDGKINCDIAKTVFWSTKKCRYSFIIIIVMIFIFCFIYINIRHSSALTSNDLQTANIVVNSSIIQLEVDKNDSEISSIENVYTLPAGGKFHTKDCRYIKNKKNVTSLPISDARHKGLTPCTVCQPKEKAVNVENIDG